MKLLNIIFGVLILLMISINVIAIGVSPAKTVINNPNKTNLFEVSVTIHNNNKENIFVDSYAEGNIILLNNDTLKIPSLSSKSFLAQVQLIENRPGETGGNLFFAEKRSGNGIQTIAEVGHKVKIFNPSDSPFVDYEWSIHEDKDDVYISFQNLGPTINITPKIIIDSNVSDIVKLNKPFEQEVGNIKLEPFDPIVKIIPLKFDKIGEYIVSLIFDYENNNKTMFIYDNKTITIGVPKFLVNKFQVNPFNIGEIVKIETDYNIEWNKELQEKPILRVYETDSLNENLTIAMKSTKLLAELDAFTEDLTVFYFNSSKVSKSRLLFELNIEANLKTGQYNHIEFFEYNIDKEQKERQFIIIIIILILIFFILTILLLFKFSKQNKKVKSEINSILKKR